MTLGRAVRRGLLRAACLTLLVGGTHAMTPPPVLDLKIEHAAPPAPSIVAGLMAKHHCWSGAAPAGVTVPGHVVVTTHGHTIYSARLVGPALDQTFVRGVDNGLVIHGFCR
jgi:hypothetical protein